MAEMATLDAAQEESHASDRQDGSRTDEQQDRSHTDEQHNGYETDEQHLRALRRANRVRLARAEMKRRIRAGHLSAAEVILHCPWQAHSMEISDLLMSQKRWGLARCKRLLASIGVPENKQIGALTERQRIALLSAFSGA